MKPVLFVCYAILLSFTLFSGCGQPVLESSECIESRDRLKKFYSFHIGNDMTPSKENFEKRKGYLTKALVNQLSAESETKVDHFTQTDNYPETFRAGKCETTSENQAAFEVVLFWRTDDKNIQKKISVEMRKEAAQWRINKVTAQN